MIRALFPLLLLTACASFPQVDAATPANMAPRPAYLTPDELAQINARRGQESAPLVDTAGDALRAQAAGLRAR